MMLLVLWVLQMTFQCMDFKAEPVEIPLTLMSAPHPSQAQEGEVLWKYRSMSLCQGSWELISLLFL